MSKFLKDFRISFLLIILLQLGSSVVAQRNNVWIFGDSARLDFNQLNTPQRSSVKANLGSSCISDNNGNLLFYVEYKNLGTGGEGIVYNSSDQIMSNGVNIFNASAVHSNLILPLPNSDSIYYLFTSFQFPIQNQNGIYYSIINPLVNGVGNVIQKNIPIMLGVFPNDGFCAVKHGNGRDWWIYWRNFDRQNFTTKYNSVYRALLAPDGLSPYSIQYVGDSSVRGSWGAMNINKQGTKAVYANGWGLIEMYDIDRCTGLLGNPILIKRDSALYDVRTDVEFSASGKYLYVVTTRQQAITFIEQFDLTASNIFGSRCLITTFPLNEVSASVKRWYDDKVYISIADGTYGSVYPDTFYSSNSTYLAVINEPDSACSQSNYNRYGQYLNGARAYFSLPNTPNFELGSVVGSVCDTLAVGVDETQTKANQFVIYPNPASNELNIVMNYFSRLEKLKIRLYDNYGRRVFEKLELTNLLSFQIDCAEFSDGIYYLELLNEKAIETKKIIIQH
jgi:hypothetical protein